MTVHYTVDLGVLFFINMIIKEKECPFEKRVPLAIKPFYLSDGCHLGNYQFIFYQEGGPQGHLSVRLVNFFWTPFFYTQEKYTAPYWPLQKVLTPTFGPFKKFWPPSDHPNKESRATLACLYRTLG